MSVRKAWCSGPPAPHSTTPDRERLVCLGLSGSNRPIAAVRIVGLDTEKQSYTAAAHRMLSIVQIRMRDHDRSLMVD